MSLDKESRVPILAFYHLKGGVGKTATAVNIAYLAAQSGADTLLCDLDPQSSATFYFRVKPKFKSGSKGFVKGGKHVMRNIKGTDYAHLDLLPGDLSHRHLALTFDKVKRSKARLHEMLEPLGRDYTYLMLDCPPTMTLVAENIMVAAEYILVPVVPSILSVRSFQQLLAFVDERGYDPQKIIPFFSMVQRSKKMHREIVSTTLEQNGNFLHTTIPFVSAIEKMGITREPVPVTTPNAPAAHAYRRLWEEIQGVIGRD